MASASILAALFFVGSWVPGWLTGTHPLAPWLHYAYGTACHQLPERSLMFAGVTQSICARCSGLFLGGLFGLLFATLWVRPGRRIAAKWLALALVPTAVDALLPLMPGASALGISGLANVPRHLISWPAGFVAALFLAIALSELTAGPRPVLNDPSPEVNHG